MRTMCGSLAVAADCGAGRDTAAAGSPGGQYRTDAQLAAGRNFNRVRLSSIRQTPPGSDSSAPQTCCVPANGIVRCSKRQPAATDQLAAQAGRIDKLRQRQMHNLLDLVGIGPKHQRLVADRHDRRYLKVADEYIHGRSEPSTVQRGRERPALPRIRGGGLHRRFARLDHAARQRHLPGVGLHRGRTQDRRNRPAAGCRSSTRAPRPGGRRPARARDAGRRPAPAPSSAGPIRPGRPRASARRECSRPATVVDRRSRSIMVGRSIGG